MKKEIRKKAKELREKSIGLREASFGHDYEKGKEIREKQNGVYNEFLFYKKLGQALEKENKNERK